MLLYIVPTFTVFAGLLGTSHLDVNSWQSFSEARDNRTFLREGVEKG
jgi:hypothetical protein